MRTTIDIDDVILREAKARAADEGKTLGQLVSELLAPALKEPPRPAPEFVWHTQSLGVRVDLEDKDAVQRALDKGYDRR